MIDASGIILLLLSGAVSFGVLKKGQSDTSKDVSKISAGVEALQNTAQTLLTASAVQTQTLKTLEIEQDDMKGDIRRHDREVGAIKEWRSAAEQRIKQLETKAGEA